MAITEENWQKAKANLFPEAILAIADRQTFPRHMYAHQANSSQAQAIGVLGIIKASPDAHVICGEITEKLGLSSLGPRTVELEWQAPRDLLGELRPS